MDDRRKSPVAVLVISAIPLLLAALYVSGYFALGRCGSDELTTVRVYPQVAIARLYYPLAFVEAKATRKQVFMFPSDGGYSVVP